MQLGPFHVFYTFSCGEMRWIEVFLSLFKQKGYQVECPNDWDGNDEDIHVHVNAIACVIVYMHYFSIGYTPIQLKINTC